MVFLYKQKGNLMEEAEKIAKVEVVGKVWNYL